jgi:hypothetical protein
LAAQLSGSLEFCSCLLRAEGERNGKELMAPSFPTYYMSRQESQQLHCQARCHCPESGDVINTINLHGMSKRNDYERRHSFNSKKGTYFSCGGTHIGVQLSDHAVCKLLKTKQDTKNQNTPNTESWSNRLHHPIWSSPWATGSVRNNQKGLHQRLLPDKAKAVQ